MPGCLTNPEEFKKFNELLTKNNTEYRPFYFTLEREGKDPLSGKSWKNNRKTFREAYYLMKKGFNIGIAGTDKDNLVIVDVDDLSQVPEIKQTLQITSRKRIGRHNYFFSVDWSAKRNISTGGAGEVRSIWQYVVAPGSFVPCSDEEISKMPEDEKMYAGRYTLKNRDQVSDVTFDELPEVYKTRDAEARSDALEKAIREINKNESTGKSKSALWSLDISDVSGVSDTKGSRVPMPPEIHGSETGKNCSVSKGLLHCWRHDVAHNAFSYLAVLAGVSSCERAGMPHHGHGFGVDSQDGETVFEVWKYAKEAGFIPIDDPIPQSALIYFALKHKICAKKDIRNGKIPSILYHITLLAAKREGITFGRM
jgi:putative DNA primase/helicase